MRQQIKKTILLAFFGILGVQLSFAQLNEGGTPFSFTTEKSATLSVLEIVEMDYVDVEALKAEDRTRDFAEPGPYRFGFNHEVSFNPNNSGTWDVIKEDHRIWRLAVRSKDALSINLLFNNFNLPEGAKLFIYSIDKRDILGAFTHRNNQADGQFATGFLFTDTVIIEYYEPAGVAFEGTLNLARVTHGYRSVGDYANKAFGSSGSCNMNVGCPQTAGWEDQIRSTAMLVTGSSGFCSGTLINNTAQDGTPFFLSANHCHRDPGGVVFWFNWQSETCSNPSTSPSRDVMSGAVTRSRNSASDFWLMELNQQIPDEYNVYFSGWNRTLDDAIDGYIVGIHHPRGDIKKFSYTNDGVTRSSYLGATNSGTTHWRVGFWEGGTTTEPGSSGSSLYDSNQRLIGQLHGGYAACGNTREDWYGRLGVSWTGGGTPSTRLSDWLDPAGSGVMVLDGFDPNSGVLDVDAQLSAIVSPSGNYNAGETITPQVVIRNGGILPIQEAEVTYTINGGTPASITWTGNLETTQTATVTFPSITPSMGEYEFVASVNVPGDENPNNNSRTVNFIVFDCSAAGTMPFFENFEGVTDCWEVVDNIGNGQVWKFGTNNRGNNSLPGSFGNYAYLDSDAYGNGNNQNSDLITPTLNLSNYDDVVLSFDHFFRQYQTSTASVHYSVDNGQTWTQIQQWTTNTTNPTSFSQAVPAVNGQSQVKFKWRYVGAWDWYWSVDNISIDGTRTGYDDSMLQVLHNAADPSLTEVDLYLNGDLHTSGFSFRNATEMFAVTPEVEHTIHLTLPGSSTPILSKTHMFEEGESYVFVVNGVANPAGFAPNPDGRGIGAQIDVLTGMHSHTSSDVMIYVYHGSSDAPTVNITLEDGTLLFENLSYGDLAEDMLEVNPDSYMLQIRHASTNEVLFQFEADVAVLGGEVVGLYASGFANPSANQNGSPFSLVALLTDGTVVELRNATSAGNHFSDMPSAFELLQNYPNPFNPTTSIRYNLPVQSQVRIEVYNLMGQRIATLVNGVESAGFHTVNFDASNLSSGLYIYRLQAGEFVETRKMMLVK